MSLTPLLSGRQPHKNALERIFISQHANASMPCRDLESQPENDELGQPYTPSIVFGTFLVTSYFPIKIHTNPMLRPH